MLGRNVKFEAIAAIAGQKLQFAEVAQSHEFREFHSACKIFTALNIECS